MKGGYRLIKWVGGAILVSFFFLAVQTEVAKADRNSAPSFQATQPAAAEKPLLTEDDLPGFRPASEGEIAGSLALAKRLTSGLYSPQTKIVQFSSFRSRDILRSEYVISLLALPISEREELAFDALAQDPRRILDSLSAAAQSSGNTLTPQALPSLSGLADASMGFSMTIGLPPVDRQMDFVWVRRGGIIHSLWVIYPGGGTPSADLRQLALLADQRVTERYPGTVFRPAGPLVPDITTRIPTPLDVSTRPEVIYTNLFLAALMMLPFAVAAETFTRLSAENEELLQEKFRPVRSILSVQRRVITFLENRSKGGGVVGSVLRIVWIMVFYGLAFSLLDRDWNPLNLTGLVLFLDMTVAYGIVGIADDIVQWRLVKKWKQPADLSLRPTNILIAGLSTLTSRLLALSPGLMFGTPEALNLDRVRLGVKRRNTLLKISAYTLLAIGFGLWALTAITAYVERQTIPLALADGIGWLQAFLLVVFAVALENTFVQMLGLPGTFGEALRKKNRWLWLLGLVGITFVFYHTLINPRGELAAALQESNVWIFLGVSGAFALLTLGLWLYIKIKGTKRIEASRPVKIQPVREKLKQFIPAWVWLALAFIGVTVIGTILLARREAALQASLQPPPALVAAVSTATPAPSQAAVGQIPAVYSAPAVVQKLCYVPSIDIAKDINDQYLWRSLQVVAAEYGAQAITLTPPAASEAGYTQAVDQFIETDCSLIVGDWTHQQDVFRTAAVGHPDRKFLLLGYFSGQRPDLPNLWVTEYRFYEGAFLAGYLAAGSSRSGIVGTFAAGGEPPADLGSLDCFELGATFLMDSKYLPGKVEVIGWDGNKHEGMLAGSRTDPAAGEAFASELISKGADVIFPLAGWGGGSTGSGSGLAAIQNPGVALIGSGMDLTWAMPEFSDQVIASVEVRYDASIAIATEALANGAFNGAKYQGSLASGEIGLSPPGPSSRQIPDQLKSDLALYANSDKYAKCMSSPAVSGFLNIDSVGLEFWHPGALIKIQVFASPGGSLLYTSEAIAGPTGQAVPHLDIDLLPGMFLQVTDGSDTNFVTLAPLTVDVYDEANGIVSGTAKPGAEIYVMAGEGMNWSGNWNTATADANGHWQVDFTGQYDLTSQSTISVDTWEEGSRKTVIKIGPDERNK